MADPQDRDPPADLDDLDADGWRQTLHPDDDAPEEEHEAYARAHGIRAIGPEGDAKVATSIDFDQAMDYLDLLVSAAIAAAKKDGRDKMSRAGRLIYDGIPMLRSIRDLIADLDQLTQIVAVGEIDGGPIDHYSPRRPQPHANRKQRRIQAANARKEPPAPGEA